ncbi:hypothetical protein AAHK20_28690 [Trinickia sp. YCB016]
MNFDIQYTAKDGKAATYRHTMYVSNEDPVHGNRSTLGYGDIDMPHEMQGKGIGYTYHAAAAQAAKELGVHSLVVDDCVSEPMRNLCEKTGMSDANSAAMYSFAGNPDAMIANNQSKASQRGWTQS